MNKKQAIDLVNHIENRGLEHNDKSHHDRRNGIYHYARKKPVDFETTNYLQPRHRRSRRRQSHQSHRHHLHRHRTNHLRSHLCRLRLINFQ